MTLTVFGASGPTGKQLVAQAVGRGHDVIAVVRSTAPDSRFPDPVRVIEANVYEGDGVETVMEDATVVCNLLRHSKVTPPNYITVGGGHVLDAMESAGVDRYLTVVPAAVRRDGERTGMLESLSVSAFRLFRPAVTADSADHVADITSRDLDWTVVRVLRLTDGGTSRQYKTGDIPLGVGGVSHGDVAAFLLDCYERRIYLGMQPKIRT